MEHFEDMLVYKGYLSDFQQGGKKQKSFRWLIKAFFILKSRVMSIWM